MGRLRRFRVFALAFAGMVLMPLMSRAETIVLDDTTSVFDGAIYGAIGCSPEFPGASCEYFNMGGQALFWIGKTAAHVSTCWRTLMGFDLSDAINIASSEIDSSILTLTVQSAEEADSLLYIGFQSLNYDVIEGDCPGFTYAEDSSFTWSARIFKADVDTVLWQTPGVKGSEDREDSIYAVSPPIGGAGSYRIDVTGLVRYWLDSTATIRWCVLADTVQLAGGRGVANKVFRSSESIFESSRPKLEIFYRSSGLRRGDVLSGGLLK